ncbi:hypothetical protein M409DRAFT_25402 [Zasmidium cellare ATCC 36951]|uniref:SET domain-containing protein n=1 Tax=Zasmidium cellare ATCC 36951 TaxID=1080233 RepID=A0A6A6CB83_ZASCE|nr:uncharacterized protein M409DRAFT_25402 [Zasmidium cellare ATCC 36951]KAF2164053.1 hypothetical protein M409DRAFT_25402 [Zasmidium cellare ATCC 36951]
MQAPGSARGNYNYYTLRDVPGKDRGAFALNSLKAGTKILVDKPLMVFNTALSHISPIDTTQKYHRMSPQDRAEFDRAPGILPGGHQGIVATHDMKFHLNRFTINDGKSGCFVHASRFNHSCVPNCSMTPTSNDSIQCILIKDVPAGEELTFAYNENFLYLTSVQRAQYLKNLRFTFRDCLCAICTQPERDRADSDRRRALMREDYYKWSEMDIVREDGFPMPEAKLEAALGYDYCFQNKVTEHARAFVELAEQEGILSSLFLELACLFLAEAQNHGPKAGRDFQEIKKWTERTIELRRNRIGEEGQVMVRRRSTIDSTTSKATSETGSWLSLVLEL